MVNKNAVIESITDLSANLIQSMESEIMKEFDEAYKTGMMNENPKKQKGELKIQITIPLITEDGDTVTVKDPKIAFPRRKPNELKLDTYIVEEDGHISYE